MTDSEVVMAIEVKEITSMKTLMETVLAANVVWTVCKHGIDPRLVDSMKMSLVLTDAISNIYKWCTATSLVTHDSQAKKVDMEIDEPNLNDSQS
jgi:hypothetical protein